MVLLLKKLYLYFTKDPDKGGGPTFSRGGGGVQMLITIETHTYLLFSRGGGGVRTPYPPLNPHSGNVIITGQYLSQSGF